MLTLHTGRGGRDCAGISRREFIRVGALGAGGLTLPWLLGAKAQAASSTDYVRDKTVVLLFLTGGPSHIETWDPKMTAPVEIRSMTGEVKTALPGVTFGATFPKIATLADKLAVVRSFSSGTGSHNGGTERILRGANPSGSSMGAAYARLRGATHPVTGMPTFAQINDPDGETAYANGRKRVIGGNGPGPLGAAYAPLDPSVKGKLQENMTLRICHDWQSGLGHARGEQQPGHHARFHERRSAA